jgi:hypothetical protein
VGLGPPNLDPGSGPIPFANNKEDNPVVVITVFIISRKEPLNFNPTLIALRVEIVTLSLKNFRIITLLIFKIGLNYNLIYVVQEIYGRYL